MVERLGEMGKGEERGLRKGARERIEKRERDKKFEEKEGLRNYPFFRISRSGLRCSHCFFKPQGMTSCS